MAASRPHDLLVGEMGGRGSPGLLAPGPRVGRKGGVRWQQDTGGNWTRLLGGVAAAVRSEAATRGLEVRSVNSPPVTNIIRVSQNHQHLHKELLFTHRKGLSLRSKPELLQVLEHRNRRREGMESSVEQSPLERELQRWQQKREQHQQQEESNDTLDNQPEFIRVRGNLRRIPRSREVSPQRAAPPSTSSSLLRPHLTNSDLSEVPEAESPRLPGSSDASVLSSAPSQCSLNANT